MRIIIVGGSIAGVNAALACRQEYPNAQITLIEQQAHLGHLPRELFFSLEQQQFTSHELVLQEEINKTYQIEVFLETKCERLRDHEVELSDTTRLPFDKLIIATGSTQRSRLAGTHETFQTQWLYKSVKDQHEIYNKIKQASSIAIVGAGAVGISFASALAKQEKKITIYERNERPLARYFDEDMTPILTRFLQANQMDCLFGQAVEQITPTEKGYQVTTANTTQSADLVLLAVNTRPETQELTTYLAKNTDGTLWVDDYLQTSQTDVFAIGDAIHVKFRPTKEELYISSIENARRTAEVVAKNLHRLIQKDIGSIRPFEGNFFGVDYLSLGLLEQEAIFVDYPVAIKSLKLTATTFLKIVFHKKTRRLLGLQLVAQEVSLQVKGWAYQGVDDAIVVDEWLTHLSKMI